MPMTPATRWTIIDERTREAVTTAPTASEAKKLIDGWLDAP
jgi:hypothetical protein